MMYYSMMTLYYVTGNQNKFDNASSFMSKSGIRIVQKKLKLDEVQAIEGKEIALKKVREAFKELNEPVFINDASWRIPSLNGFPGPFMNYVTKWLTNDDILNMMTPKTDRNIILIDVIAYKDANIEKIFVEETHGKILLKPEGITNGPEITKIISLSDDNKSLAITRADGFTPQEQKAWTEFANWINENNSSN